MRRNLYVLAVAFMMIAFTAPMTAQDRDQRSERRSEGNRDFRESRAYRAGYKDGLQDAQRRRSSRPENRRWRNDFDRDAYRSGYQAGYNEATNGGRYGNGPRDRDDHDNRGGYTGGGRYGANDLERQARQTGYGDGVYYAQRDMQGRHSANPYNAKGYKDADHNYHSDMGSKSEFQRIYREAFVEGYRRTYR
jgi:hypothetical protein